MKEENYLIEFTGGFLGGVAATFTGHPLDTIKIRLQTQTKNNTRFETFKRISFSTFVKCNSGWCILDIEMGLTVLSKFYEKNGFVDYTKGKISQMRL